LVVPPSLDAPPAGYSLTGREAYRIGLRSESIQEVARKRDGVRAIPFTRGPDRWQIVWEDKSGKDIAMARVDDSSRELVEAWTGYQAAWPMARGYPGDFGATLNAPYVWIPLALLFLAPFVDVRRPFRLLHLDLLVLLGLGVSNYFFTEANIGVSVPLVYAVLLYLLGRMLWAGFRPRSERGRLVPHIPLSWLAVGLVLLAGFHVGLTIVDSDPEDIGLASVVGADRLAKGDDIYGLAYTDDLPQGDTYGPLTYLIYVPFEQIWPWSGKWDRLPAAQAAAIAFDLLTILLLVLLGRRLRPGLQGRELGLSLGYAWAAYPYVVMVLEIDSNDALVPLFTVLAMLGLTIHAARGRVSALLRGGAIALGAAAKVAPAALGPLFATARAGGGSREDFRGILIFAAAFVVVIVSLVLPFIPDGGLRELYDRTVGFQVSRESPFSVWGQIEGGEAARSVMRIAAAALAVAVAFVPRRKSPVQVAALGAAVLIAGELGMSHWFYTYAVWFLPLALVAMMAPYCDRSERVEGADGRLASDPVAQRRRPRAVSASRG
jgi:hypothetical protein